MDNQKKGTDTFNPRAGVAARRGRRGLTALWALGLVLAALAGAAAPSVRAQECAVFHPKTYTLVKDAPAAVDNFSAQNPSGTFRLIVQNGNANGERRVKGDLTVSSGEIFLNGVEVVKESDFNQNVARIEKLVTVKAANTLSVLLKGGAGSNTEQPPFVVVKIVRVTNETNGPAITINQPTAGQVVGASPVTVSGTVTDESDVVSLTVNGAPAPVAAGAFSAQVALTPGQNTVTVVAKDCAGNTSTKTVAVVFDTGAPTLTVNGPANGSLTRNATAQVAGTVSDDVAVSGVTVNGQPAALSGGNFTASVTLAEGANPINVVATDSAGKQSTASLSVTLDTVAPAVQIISPTAGQIVGASPAVVTGTVTDVSGVSELKVNGVTTPVTNGAFTAQVILQPGRNTITVTATDFAGGNTASGSVEAVFDTQAPQVTITSPSNGLLTKNQTLEVTGTAADDAGITGVTVNGQPATLNGDTFTVTLTLAEGSNPITAVATDNAGRQSSASVAATLDTIAPVINIASPAAGSILAGSPAAVSGTVSDANGVTSLTVNGVETPVTNGSFSAQVALQPGRNTITVAATDFAGGNSADSSVEAILDASSPQVTITSPAPDFLTNGRTVQVSGTATDDGAVSRVTVNGQEVALSGGAFSASVTLNEGANDIAVVATDTTGKQGEAGARVILDTTPPTIAVNSPAAGARIYADTVDLAAQVSDPNGVASASVNNVPVSLAGGGFTQAVALQTGDNPLVITAVDRAGNVQTLTHLIVRIRFTPLGISITSPEPQSLFRQSSVTVRGTVDAAATSVVVNGVAAVLGGGQFTADGVPLREGINLVTAAASNADAGSGSASVTVISDTSPPTIRIDSPTEGAILASSVVTVTGMLNDVVSGTVNAEQATVTVNGVEASVSNRTFVAPDLLLVRGLNTLTAVVRDRAGNESRHLVRVTVQDTAGQQRILSVGGNNQTGVIGTTLRDPLAVQLVDANGNPMPNRPVTFTVRRSDGIVRSLPQEGREITVISDGDGRASAQFQLGTRAGVGNNTVNVTSSGFTDEVMFSHSATVSDPTQIHGAMVMGEAAMGIAGKPLPMPFDVIITDAGGNPVPGVPITFKVELGGGKINDAVSVVKETDSDGKASVLPVLGEQEGIGNNLFSASFTPVGAEGPTAQTTVHYKASGMVQGAAEDTRVSGVVLDNQNRPIPHAQAKIVGRDDLMAYTNAEGQFTIPNAPVGTITLIVDGGTTTRPERFPFLAFQIMNVSGQDNTVGMPIFIPFLDTDNAKIVGGGEDVVLTMKGVPGVAFTVFANSVVQPDGTKYVGPMMLTQVNADKVPMPPPNGTAPRIVWTLQPANMHFTRPIQVQLPNSDGMPPGQVIEVFSFDHALEQFVSGGMARVSADGSVIVSDPGFGVTVSGWGGAPPPPPPKKCVGGCDDRNPCTQDSCVDGACRHTPMPEGAACSDSRKPCETNGRCTGGACVGTPVTVDSVTGQCVAATNQNVTFTAASNAPDKVRWRAPGGNPATGGPGGSFGTAFAAPGSKTVTAYCASASKSTNITIVNGCPANTAVTPTYPLHANQRHIAMGANDFGKVNYHGLPTNNWNTCFDGTNNRWAVRTESSRWPIDLETQLPAGIAQIRTGPGGNSTSGNYCDQVRDVIELSVNRSTAGVNWFDRGIIDFHERTHVTQRENYWNNEWATLEAALEAMSAPNTVCTATAARTQVQAAVQARITQSLNTLATRINGDRVANENAAQASEAGTRTALINAICAYGKAQGWPACGLGLCPP